MTTPVHPLLRRRGSHDAGKVSMVELFFDLVFVFAVTQLSHGLLERPTPLGALQTGMLMLAMWAAWMATSWVTNWLDPGRIAVRAMLFALMLAGLVAAVAIPGAFGERGLAFAAAFVAMQLGRTGFFLWAVRRGPAHMRGNFQRVFVWYLVESILWILGGLAEPGARLAWWGGALALGVIGPWAYFWVPGLGRSSTADWDVDGEHMAERCALFVIIALGESLLITGATFSELALDAAATAGFLAAFFGAVAMWWIYFHAGAEHGSHRIAAAADPGRTARIAYTYLHIPIVAGIIATAAGDEMILVHPGHADGAAIAAVLGGPALFILGVGAFKWVNYDRRAPPLSHLIGLILLAPLLAGALAHWFTAVQLSAAATAVLAIVALWETFALRRSAPSAGHNPPPHQA